MLPKCNVYPMEPRTLIPPAAIVKPAPHNTIDYEQAYSSSQARWLWLIMIVVGQVNDEAAQNQVGELLSPNSDLIQSINNCDFGQGAGWAKVMRGNAAQLNFKGALYSYAELSVRVTA